MSSEEYFKPWRNDILAQLEKQRQNQCDQYIHLIKSHTQLHNASYTYMRENAELKAQTQQLASQLQNGRFDNGNEKMLEKKIGSLQEELTVLYRSKGEHTQMIIDLNQELKEKDIILSEKEAYFSNAQRIIDDLTVERNKLLSTMNDLESTKEALINENQAIRQLLATSERRETETNVKNAQLITRLMEENSKLSNELNHQSKLLEERQNKRNEPINSSSDIPAEDTRYAAFITSIPDRPRQKLECHDGEITSVCFSPSGKQFLTGGLDRKVKVWSVGRTTCENIATLQGSSLSITSTSFDATEQFVLASSNDEACRLWSLNEQRLRHTLTGHTGKVLSAEFFGSDSNKVVSGSHDRTLKIWDTRTKVCTKTFFAGSSCNDLVTSNSAGPKLMSGHFDKRVRFWDMASEKAVNEVQLNGKVTSLDLSADRYYLLACSRGNSLNILDLRTYKIISSFESENFRTAYDYTRACFSPDGRYVMCGSHDGSVFIWNTQTSILEKVLTEHQTAVVATAWHPNGRLLLSSDRNKNVILWSDV